MVTNLDGVFQVAQPASALEVTGEEGVILFICLTNGIMGYHLYADYNATEVDVIDLPVQ